MSIAPEQDQQEIDPEAIKAYEDSIKQKASSSALLTLATRRIFRDHGFTHVVDGEEKVNWDSLRKAAFAVIENHGVVVDKDSRDSVLDADALTGEVLPDVPAGPTADGWDELDAEKRKAWRKAKTDVLKQVQTHPNAPMQRMAADLDENLMVVKTASGEVYLTGEVKYIKTDVVQEILDDVVLRSTAAGAAVGLFGQQVPALKRVSRSMLKKASKEAAEKMEAAYTLAANNDEDDE